MIERLKSGNGPGSWRQAALVLGVLYLFPAAWPLKVEYPLLELWFLVMVPCTWYSLWHFYGKRRMLRPRGILWTLWPVLQTAGALWAVADPDRGALGAAFLQQLFYLAPGGGIRPVRDPVPAPDSVQRRAGADHRGLLELPHLFPVCPAGTGLPGFVGRSPGGDELDPAGACTRKECRVMNHERPTIHDERHTRYNP